MAEPTGFADVGCVCSGWRRGVEEKPPSDWDESQRVVKGDSQVWA